jgi:L-seryl-tRNA(Ser) seleniumtransferase
VVGRNHRDKEALTMIRNCVTRRTFLGTTAATAVAATARVVASPAPTATAVNVYEQLGIRPVINGVGVVTYLGGSIMPEEVVQAMEEAAKHFVPLQELQKKVGVRIAELLGVPAAMVTAGCASAITVATAACVADGEADKLDRLPDTAGMRNEIVQQKSHRSGYEQQMLLVGTKIVWVETREELDHAINERTAMMFFLNKADPDGKIRREEWIRVGKDRGVPTFNDAASDAPPKEALWKYIQEGFDLVAFSGGKALRGPQCSGLLLGRKDLIESAMLAISPNDGIGRGMKVGKEEIIGLMAAVQRYLKVDQARELEELESRVADMVGELSKLNGLKLVRFVPEIANHVPHVNLTWEEGGFPMTAEAVATRLLEGDPPIAVAQRGERELRISVWMMRPGEHRVVIKRLQQIFAA